MISNLDVDIAKPKFTETLFYAARLFISQKAIASTALSHPWMSDTCRSAIAYKHFCINTIDYERACVYCSDVLAAELHAFVLRIKTNRQSLHRASKSYWKLVKKLMFGCAHKLSVACRPVKHGVTARSGYEEATFFG